MYLGLSYKLLMWSFCRVARLQILKNNNWSASQILSSMLIWFFFFRLEANNPYAFFQHLISPLDAVLYFINNLLALKSLIDYKKKIINRRHTGRKIFFLFDFIFDIYTLAALHFIQLCISFHLIFIALLYLTLFPWSHCATFSQVQRAFDEPQYNQQRNLHPATNENH